MTKRLNFGFTLVAVSVSTRYCVVCRREGCVCDCRKCVYMRLMVEDVCVYMYGGSMHKPDFLTVM